MNNKIVKSYRIEEDLHKKFQQKAWENKTGMGAIIRELISEYVGQEEKYNDEEVTMKEKGLIEHNGYWIEGVTRSLSISKGIPYWTWVYHSGKKNVSRKTVPLLIKAMKSKGYPVKILSEEEYSLKMKRLTYIYNPKEKAFAKSSQYKSGCAYQNPLTLSEVCLILRQIEKGVSDREIAGEFLSSKRSGVYRIIDAYKWDLLRVPAYFYDEIAKEDIDETVTVQDTKEDIDETVTVQNTKEVEEETNVTKTLDVNLPTSNILTKKEFDERMRVIEGKLDSLAKNYVTQNTPLKCYDVEDEPAKRGWWGRLFGGTE